MKYNFGVAVLEGSVPFINIYKIDLVAKINEHAKLQVWGILDEQDAGNVVQWNQADEIITVTLSDGQIFFSGLISEIEIIEKSNLFQACITCVSATFLLDIYSRRNSYQDVNQNFADVLKEAYKKENHALCIPGKEANVLLEEPVFQYNETAWDFTLRMANRLMTYVVADHQAAYPCVRFGGQDDSVVSWDKLNYVIGYTQESGYFYSCKTMEHKNIGNHVILNDRCLLIVEKHSVFINGEFINTYVLGTDTGYSVKNCKRSLAGCRIRGTVLDTSGEFVKLHLDIDAVQDIEKAYWFEYAPQTGNVMYCMPQRGTKVMLRFYSDLDNFAVAEECWRENGNECSELADFKNRYFTTEFGKRLAMLPETIFLTGNGNHAELSERAGIYLQSGSFTRIIGENIRIMAGKKCRIKIPRHLYITKPNTQSVIDFAGNEINIDSSNINLKTNMDTEAEKPYSPCDTALAVSINRRLAYKALAFAPQKSGKGII